MKIINDSGLNAQELFDFLSQFSDEERRNMPLYLREKMMTANIVTLDGVEKSTYGFFGKQLPCIIFEKEQ